jgi:D-sedoheptulose 7-phosphate isomerase
MTNQTTLKALYPFLHGDKQDAGKLEAALAHSVATKAAESRDANAQFFE